MDGTALTTGATATDTFAYAGTAPAGSTKCKYQSFTTASLPNIVIVQEWRPVDAIGQTCDL